MQSVMADKSIDWDQRQPALGPFLSFPGAEVPFGSHSIGHRLSNKVNSGTINNIANFPIWTTWGQGRSPNIMRTQRLKKRWPHAVGLCMHFILKQGPSYLSAWSFLFVITKTGFLHKSLQIKWLIQSPCLSPAYWGIVTHLRDLYWTTQEIRLVGLPELDPSRGGTGQRDQVVEDSWGAQDHWGL